MTVCEVNIDQFSYREAPKFADEAMENLSGEVSLGMAMVVTKAIQEAT